MKARGFNPEQYALKVGEELLGVKAADIDAELINHLQSLPAELRPRKLSGHRPRAEGRGNHTRRSSRGAILTAGVLTVAAVAGFGVVKYVNGNGEQAAPDGAEAFALSYFSSNSNDKSQPVATVEYKNTGEIQANYTKADGKIGAVPPEVIGQKLPVSDAGKATIAVTWLGSDSALSTKDGKVYVSRNEFGLTATNLTAAIPAKRCEQAPATTFQDSLCMTFLSTKVTEKTDIGFPKEQADAVNALIYTDGKTYNASAVLGIYVMQTSAGLNTKQFNECMVPATAIADGVLANRYKDKGEVMFYGAYKTVGETYNEQADVKTILGADALSVTAVATTCNKAVGSGK